MTDQTTERKVRLLRYGELAMRKARDEASQEELAEMEEIRKELDLSESEIIAKVESIVKKNY
ncbi:MAG TPA: hypothetical protein VHE10_03380 [Candidatus Paceibacterota bacterium]|nr:hypothetical protein [Candidatus Paceibacterota bacterium]